MSKHAPLALLLACCSYDSQIADRGDSAPPSAQERLGLADAQVRRILDFLNDCATSFQLLDDDVPLDSDTAENLVRHRDGDDAVCGSHDDDPYDDLDEVDDVPQVGDASIMAILEYLDHGAAGGVGDTWDGVSFSAHEAEVVLEIANQASYELLDVDVGLDSDAAANIVDHRPHDTMQHLADTPQVGSATLQALKDYVLVWESGG